jgi:hypothetical protein
LRFTSLVLVCIAAATAAAQSYDPASGPSILSRGSRVGTRGNEAAVLNFTLGVDGIYDSSLGALILTPDGINKQESGEGVEARATLYGVHNWKRSSLGVSYNGSYAKYIGSDNYNGTTQTLALNFSQQNSKRLQTNYKLAAGTSNLPYGGVPGFGGFGSAGALDQVGSGFLAVPAAELFNNRVNYAQGGVGFVYQKSTRLSFGVNASGYAVRREAKGLGGLNGYMGGADMSYRMSKRSTVFVNYSFTHLVYPGSFGASDVHGIGAGVARSIGRDWQINASAMLNRVESLGLTRVTLDPIVASLLGQSSGVEAFYSKNFLPGFSVSATRRFRQGSLNLIGSKSITPGNGLFLTSQQTGITAGYSYTGLRHWSIYASTGYSKMSSLTRSMGTYSGFTAGVGASRELLRSVHFTSRWDYRDQLIAGSTFSRSGSRVSVGLTWSLRDVPLVIW